MCGQSSRCSGGRSTRQSQQESWGCSWGCSSCCSCGCGCGSDNTQATSPTATISMADYESFILVPTSVFDQGDVDCGCNRAW